MPTAPDKLKTRNWGLGISPFDYLVLCVVRGAAYPLLYAEIGAGVSAIVRREGGAGLPEHMFLPAFMDLARRGLVVWKDAEQVYENPKERRYVLARPRGDQAMRDFKIARGDDFRFAKYFDGSFQTLNRYLGVGPKVEMRSRKHMKRDVFADHNRNPLALRKQLSKQLLKG